MLENQLIKLFRPLIQSGLAARGFNVPVKQAYQPTQQGANTENTVYFFKVGDRRIGSPERKDIYNEETGFFDHAELQKYETMFQINAYAIQNPTDTNSVTASDLVNAAAQVVQSSTFITAIEAQSVGILRVSDIRNPRFSDDKGRFEESPSFDFVLTHNQTFINNVPVINAYEYNIDRV